MVIPSLLTAAEVTIFLHGGIVTTCSSYMKIPQISDTPYHSGGFPITPLSVEMSLV